MTIDELLVNFDEMGFAPTTLCGNPDEYACEWKKQLLAEIERLTEERNRYAETLAKYQMASDKEIIAQKKQAVKEFAEKLKDPLNGIYIPTSYRENAFETIDGLLKEYEK